MSEGKEVLRRYNNLRSAASTHFSRCDVMAPFISPSRVGILGGRTPGQDQLQDVYDSTAMFAADLLAKYIAGEVINPAQRWFRWKMKKPKDAPERTQVDEWVEECTDLALEEHGTRSSNFYAESPEMLVDYAGFGTGCLMGDEKKEYRNGRTMGFRGLRFQTTKTGRFVIGEDSEGVVDYVGREWTMSATAMADRWGKDKLPETVSKCLEGERPDLDRMFTVVHAVYKRPKGERGYGTKGMPFASCWVEKESEKLIEESGYKRFPFMVPRWEKTPGEVFGRGPGDRAFPDTRTLNKVEEMELKSGALKIEPAILVANDSVIGKIRIGPGRPTMVRRGPGEAVDNVMKAWNGGGDSRYEQVKAEELRSSIRQLYFVEQILAMLKVEKAQMTAEEWRGKLMLLYKILGSVYGRMQSEFLIPETDLVFGLMYDAGAFPPPPPELHGQENVDIAVEFMNPLALAQKAGDIDAIRLSYADFIEIAMNDPHRMEAINENFDLDETARTIAETRGMPARLIRSTEDRDKVRDARVKKMQEADQMAQAGQAAQIGKDAAPLLRELKPEGSPAA